LHFLPGDDGQAQPADQLLGFTGEHAAHHGFDPTPGLTPMQRRRGTMAIDLRAFLHEFSF